MYEMYFPFYMTTAEAPVAFSVSPLSGFCASDVVASDGAAVAAVAAAEFTDL